MFEEIKVFSYEINIIHIQMPHVVPALHFVIYQLSIYPKEQLVNIVCNIDE